MSEYGPPPFLQAPPGDQNRNLQVRVDIQLTRDAFQGGDRSLAAQLAETIIAQRDSEITGWINSIRQQNAIAPIGYVSRDLEFSDCRAIYVRNGLDETLDIIIYPNLGSPGQTTIPTAGTFDVVLPFQGYPVGSFTSWGLYSWAAWNLVNGGHLTTDDQPSGLPTPWSVPKVGKTGILIEPLTGLQYFEVKILSFPKNNPSAIVTPFIQGVDDGTFLDCSIVDVNRNLRTYLFPGNYTSWLTPSIGLIPKQLMPSGLDDDVVTDDMLVGLDTDDTYNVARTIHVTPFTVQFDEVKTRNFKNPVYALANPYQSSDDDIHANLHDPARVSVVPALGDDFVLVADLLKDDYNPILYANSNPKPTIRVFDNRLTNTEFGGNPPPPPQRVGGLREDQNCVGVAGTYVLIPRGAIYEAMPLDAITLADVNAAVALYGVNGPTNNYNGEIYLPNTAPYNQGGGLWVVGAIIDAPGYFGYFSFNEQAGIGFPYIDWLGGTLKYTAGKFVDDDYTHNHLIGDIQSGPVTNYTAYSGFLTIGTFDNDEQIAYAYEPDDHLTPLTGIFETGTHTWAIKGRGDSIVNATAADDGPLIGPFGGQAQTFNAVWSGVDLGSFAEDDIIMFAVDTSKRTVYLGKNGQWYDRDGPKDKSITPGDDNLLVALMLDGDDKQEYYPAATLRVGPSHVRFQFGGSCKYPKPGGYSFYHADDVTGIQT